VHASVDVNLTHPRAAAVDALEAETSRLDLLVNLPPAVVGAA
jgi:hypothetical protein